MWRGARWYLVGSLVLVALAGCGRSYLQYAQREPWRREAEVACLKSGAVKEGAGLVRVEPIEGPGVCGAEFPLQVVALGEGPAFGFADEAVRPPGSIPRAAQPRWPIGEPRHAEPQYSEPRYHPEPRYHDPRYGEPQYSEPQYRAPPPAPRYAPPAQIGEPLSINPPGVVDPHASMPEVYHPPQPVVRAPQPELQAAPPARQLPALGPQRHPQVIGASSAVEVKPKATLACPIVSALDQWIAQAVQPAAHKWFGRPVVEIRQISAYSCRGMNGQAGARISEHAFGNALDIAAFVLADGSRITVKGGWRGSPEEQGFLRDIQAAACDQFTTVLAPGSNAFHYDHIHVDLMRRSSGRRICNPGAVDGDLIAARARRNPALAVRREVPPTRRYDPPFDARNDPFAWRGDARREDPATTGSIGSRRPDPRNPAAEDDDWVEEPGPRPAIDWSDRHKLR
jgi:hypothetical protein